MSGVRAREEQAAVGQMFEVLGVHSPPGEAVLEEHHQ